VRWWNERHPTTYARRLAEGHTPARAREVLDHGERWTERVMLELRLAEGLALADLDGQGAAAAADAVAAGLLSDEAHRRGRAVLTTRGRLFADAVVRSLLD